MNMYLAFLGLSIMLISDFFIGGETKQEFIISIAPFMIGLGVWSSSFIAPKLNDALSQETEVKK